MSVSFCCGGVPSQQTTSFRVRIEADWAAQEQRAGRTIEDPQAIRDLIGRTERLFTAMDALPDSPDLRTEQADFRKLVDSSRSIESMTKTERNGLYHQIRWLTRKTAFQNPLLSDQSILFMTRKRFICQMLHEYLGYYYDYADISGGSIYVLENPGRSFETRDLIGDRLPKGNFTTLSLSYDAQTVYFAFAERAAQKPDFYSPQRQCFHIFAMNADGSNLRQLTFGPDDDFDPCPLPDGGIAFMSSDRGGFTRCNNPWEPLPAHTLHRLTPDLKTRQTLSFHETSEWHPSVLHDGRIVYIRWDYVDRSAANFHGLWVSNPDGTAATAMFANYTMDINACYQPRAIPSSRKIAFIAGAHHANVGGSLALLDPDKVAFDPETGQDNLDSVEVLTPEVCFPESKGWPKSYFHAPWPLSEDFFLVGFSFDPLPGMSSGTSEDTHTGLYYFDRFGNMELLYSQDGISAMYPIPLRSRPVPPTIASARDPEMGEHGEFLLSDIRTGHFPLPADRPIRELRIFQVLPKSRTHVANDPRIGYANAESARMLLGTVPVEKDGSAYFRAPAGKPLYFQAVDEHGRAVQTMLSVAYLQPGERRGCIGCHERRTQSAVAPGRQLQAALRQPSEIVPGPVGTRPFSFPLLVQPILDRHCSRCHDGSTGEGKSKLALHGKPDGEFTEAYNNLKPFVRWYEWGGETIDAIVSKPGRCGADESKLAKIVTNAICDNRVKMSEEELRVLYLWLDANAPFYGTYEINERLAQKVGKNVDPPSMQ
ncbi:MAG: hypothetical protein GX455_16840 [Phycisphaerae bacterium]|nr:hypothetical protein [Phycisphaerae bacterium]